MKTTATILFLFMTVATMAQNPPPLPPAYNATPTVDVTGEGIVRVVPDEVTIQIRVENTGKIPQELKAQNDATVSEVLKFLKSMGIDDKDVKTQYITLNKNYIYESKTYSYDANQSILVKLRDMSKYEELMKGLLDSGINRIDGIEFSSSEKEALESQARKKAIEDAKKKAGEYASTLNQNIGKAVNISEFSNTPDWPQPLYKTSMNMEADMGSQQSIATGEIEIRCMVNVSFLLN